MKNFSLICLLILIISCKNKNTTSSEPSIIEDKAKWDEFVTKLVEKATPKGGYANINYREKSEGTEFIVDITTDTNSTTWKQYEYKNGNFDFKQDVNIDLIGEAKATNFVYKAYQYDLKRVNKLVAIAKEKIFKEKKIKDTRAVLYGLNSPNFTDNDFKREFNNVIWCLDPKTKTYFTFRFNYADSCEMFSQLPSNFKF
ncbi:MAG: hypothetical protein EOP00_10645 [Pedobacter sp.]|nr:MAG: hypothetical protein EOP00_10645 [Pedobacter sp.]